MPREADTGNAGDTSPWRKVRDHADRLGVGPRSLYHAIRQGELRAASVNDRGDLLIHDDWIRDWLELRAERQRARLRKVG